MLINKIGKIVLDILYPPTCVSCGHDGAWLCETCLQKTFLFRHDHCARCGEKKKKDHACAGSWPFQSITIGGSYAEPILRQLITTFKYKSAGCLEEAWIAYLKRLRQERLEPWPWSNLSELIVTSIPGDARRMRERGMDHAAKLADVVQKVLVPWATRDDLFIRTRSVSPNATLPADIRRQANVRGAFVVKKQINAPVLLVDDVLTTGATAVEAAKTLLAAGAPAVYLFTIASGK